MDRVISPPLHYFHVGSRETPVHLYIKPTRKKRLSRWEQQQILSTELSVSSSDSFLSNQSYHYWVGPSSSAQIPWVPTPGRSTRGSMAWEGPTHRLEIHPDCCGMSVMVQSEQELGGNTQDYKKKVRTLRKEVEHLRAEVNHQNCLHACEVEETEMDLQEKEAQLAHCQDKLLKMEIENVALKHTLSRSRSPSPNTRRPSSAHRVPASDLHEKEAELAECEDKLLKKELENVALKHSLSRYTPSPEKCVCLCTKPTLFTSHQRHSFTTPPPSQRRNTTPSSCHQRHSSTPPFPQRRDTHLSFTTPPPDHQHPSSATLSPHHQRRSSITPPPPQRRNTTPSPHHSAMSQPPPQRRNTTPQHSHSSMSQPPPQRRNTTPSPQHSHSSMSQPPPQRRNTTPSPQHSHSSMPPQRRNTTPSPQHRITSPPPQQPNTTTPQEEDEGLDSGDELEIGGNHLQDHEKEEEQFGSDDNL